ncbi:MAG: hypothetical protein H0T41_01640 [Rhodobacteraceae bacterium]|nr:hypothetical protein [Paracoccaceae bacterium]
MSYLCDPSYWRNHAPLGRWSMIDCEDERSVPSADYHELQLLLEEVVPRKTLRDGLEQADVFYTHREIDETVVPDAQARNELKWAAQNLEVLNNLVGDESETGRNPNLGPLDRAIDTAVELLKGRGIRYEGWNETFLYLDPKSGELRWIRSAWGASLQRHYNELPTHEKREWQVKYPWRSCKSISHWWTWKDGFRVLTYSSFWHALRISCLHDSLKPRVMDAEAQKVALIGLEIGKSQQAISKKAAEYDAIKLRDRDGKARDKGALASPFNRARKSNAYAYLEKHASEYLDFCKLTNEDCCKKAKKWAVDHDQAKEPAQRLFHQKGRLLSPGWFQDWLTEYKALHARKANLKVKRKT